MSYQRIEVHGVAFELLGEGFETRWPLFDRIADRVADELRAMPADRLRASHAAMLGGSVDAAAALNEMAYHAGRGVLPQGGPRWELRAVA